MKKLFLLFFLIFVASNFISAQRQQASIGGNVHFPVGDWADIASIGYGGSATYEHPLSKDMLGVFYVGYSYFTGDREGFSWSMVPILAGLKGYITSGKDFYIAGLLGVNMITVKSDLLMDASSTEFAGNVNFGYEIKTSESSAVDISAGLVYINDLSYIGVRAAYLFAL